MLIEAILVSVIVIICGVCMAQWGGSDHHLKKYVLAIATIAGAAAASGVVGNFIDRLSNRTARLLSRAVVEVTLQKALPVNHDIAGAIRFAMLDALDAVVARRIRDTLRDWPEADRTAFGACYRTESMIRAVRCWTREQRRQLSKAPQSASEHEAVRHLAANLGALIVGSAGASSLPTADAEMWNRASSAVFEELRDSLAFPAGSSATLLGERHGGGKSDWPLAVQAFFVEAAKTDSLLHRAIMLQLAAEPHRPIPARPEMGDGLIEPSGLGG